MSLQLKDDPKILIQFIYFWVFNGNFPRSEGPSVFLFDIAPWIILRVCVVCRLDSEDSEIGQLGLEQRDVRD